MIKFRIVLYYFLIKTDFFLKHVFTTTMIVIQLIFF